MSRFRFFFYLTNSLMYAMTVTNKYRWAFILRKNNSQNMVKLACVRIKLWFSKKGFYIARWSAFINIQTQTNIKFRNNKTQKSCSSIFVNQQSLVLPPLHHCGTDEELKISVLIFKQCEPQIIGNNKWTYFGPLGQQLWDKELKLFASTTESIGTYWLLLTYWHN